LVDGLVSSLYLAFICYPEIRLSASHKSFKSLQRETPEVFAAPIGFEFHLAEILLRKLRSFESTLIGAKSATGKKADLQRKS